MTRAMWYLAGLVLVALTTLALSLALAPQVRPPLGAALAIALGVQGPLGWWVIRSLGTDRFLAAWGVGLGARLGLIGVIALIVVPALHWRMAPVLVPLTLLLGVLLLVEGTAAALGNTRNGVR